MADALWPTLRILAERATRPLTGGDDPNDSPYDEDFVIEEVRDAMNQELKVEILQRRGGDSDDKSPISQFIYTYTDIEVQKDNTTERVFAELPSHFLSLKYNKGIRSVSENKKSTLTMIRCANPGVTANLPHADLEQRTFHYYLEGMRVYWLRNILKDGINKVMIKLIVAAPLTLNIDDPLPLLPEQVGRILDIVRARIRPLQPQDRIEDENPNLRSTNEARK